MGKPNSSDTAIGSENGTADERRTEEPPAARDTAREAEDAQRREEARQPTLSRPGGFANDPDDPTNPNEVIERHRRTLRR